METVPKHQDAPVIQTLREVLEKERFFRMIIEHDADAIVIVDRDGIVRFVNPAAEILFDRPSEQIMGEVFGFPMGSSEPQELDIIRPGKDTRVVEMRVKETELRSEIFYVADLRDITELVRLREELRALSLVDGLTGLYNRRGFTTLALQQLKIADRTQNKILLLFADLDHMKQINDTWGHAEGDHALVEAATVLKETFRESDILARIGGDEFAVLATESRSDNADILKHRLQHNVDAHNTVGSHRYHLSISVGITHYDPSHPCSIDDLISRADTLMYEQKRHKQKLRV